MFKITIEQMNAFKVLIRSEIDRLEEYVKEDGLSQEEFIDLSNSLYEYRQLLKQVNENSGLKLVEE